MPDRRNWTADDIARWWPDLAPTHRPILADACIAFDVSPDPGAIPVELLSVSGYGSRDYYDEPRVVLVTAGGRKLTWPIDQGTEYLLRYVVFHAYRTDRRSGTIDQELPLPADLALPRPQVTGIAPRPQSAGLFR